jgi:hypothetical protein
MLVCSAHPLVKEQQLEEHDALLCKGAETQTFCHHNQWCWHLSHAVQGLLASVKPFSGLTSLSFAGGWVGAVRCILLNLLCAIAL